LSVSQAMGLPTGLIQIKGRKGYYLNITVPHRLRKAAGKSVIQKKAADTLEAAKRVLAEEQVAANRLFDRLSRELDGNDDLRSKYKEWKEADAKHETDEEYLLTADEALELELNSKLTLKEDPEKPWEPLLSREDEKLLATATALKQGLHHWEEWARERELTSGTVTPLVKKRWETLLRKLVDWSNDEYPCRTTKQMAVDYKKHLLTRTSRTGKPAKQSTVAKDIRDLSAFWNWAKRHEWVTVNIWEGLARGLEGINKTSLPARELVEAADAKAMEAGDLMYLIQRFTGCRKQAVCGLRGRDIDLANGLIHFVEYEEDGRVRRLKNGQEAHVPIHPRLPPFLTKAKEQMPDGSIWPQQYKATEQSWGDRYGDTFPDKYGFNSHDLRRIVETQMAEANVSPYFAFYITGHRVPGTSKVTQQYVRPTAEELRQIVEKIH
jgi:integrase